jgi:hypothetical protein
MVQFGPQACPLNLKHREPLPSFAALSLGHGEMKDPLILAAQTIVDAAPEGGGRRSRVRRARAVHLPAGRKRRAGVWP